MVNIKSWVTGFVSGRTYTLRLIFSVIQFLVILNAFSQNTASREYKIKAAFMYTFTQFIDWPEAAFADDRSPFIIGVIGEDPFGKALEEIVTGEKVKGRPVIIQRYKNVKEFKNCHLLFISNKTENIEQVLKLASKQGTLTVSDIPNFVRLGGVIRFTTKDNKTKFEINLSSAKESDLRISSKLLKVADIVR